MLVSRKGNSSAGIKSFLRGPNGMRFSASFLPYAWNRQCRYLLSRSIAHETAQEQPSFLSMSHAYSKLGFLSAVA